MADYVALVDDHAPPPVNAQQPAPPPHLPAQGIPDDPSNIPVASSAASHLHSPQPGALHGALHRLFHYSHRSICNRAAVFLYPALLLALSAAVLAIAAADRAQGGGGAQLRLWLAVAGGLLGSMGALLGVLFGCLAFRQSSAALVLPSLFCALLVHALFTFVWFVIGNVWFTLAAAPDPAGATSSGAPSWRLVRTVYYVLLLGYMQLAIEAGVALVAWTVRRGCLCVARSESGARMEAERRRLVRGDVAGGDGQGGLANGGAHFI